MKCRTILATALSCLLLATVALGATSTFKLKDGRLIIGEWKKLGNSYSIVQSNGTRVLVSPDQIVEMDGKPFAATATPAPGAAKPAETPSNNGTTASPSNSSTAFKTAKAKADRSDAPVVSVQIWDAFIEANPDSPDLEAAKLERDAWDKLYKDNAEKIKGKWVGGKELKDLKEKCDKLYKEAIDPNDEVGVRGVSGLRKLDEILVLYPRHFGANYHKGFFNLYQATRTYQGSQDLLRKGIDAMEKTADIAPTVPEVWANLAIGYNFKGDYQKSIECAYRAVKMRDEDKDLLQTLATALYDAPPNMLNVNPKVKAIKEDADLLFRRHGVNPSRGWLYLRPKLGDASDRPPDDKAGPPGVQWSGSGFFVTADGYLLTNRHVATGESKGAVDPTLSFRVRLDDGTELPAELITVGDNCDIALMKLKKTKGRTFPALKIAEKNPNQGADAMVLGYPATGVEGYSMQISVGKVKSVNNNDEFHVWYDLNTTHGNSGGPVVDKYGRVISILTAYRQFANQSILLGVGPDQIEEFFKQAGDKAPKLEYEPTPKTGSDQPLNSEKLTEQCRPSTLLVLAIRGQGKKSPSATSKPDEATPDETPSETEK